MPGKLWDCQPLARHSQLRQGPVGQQQTAHPGTCQGSKADFPSASPFLAAQGVLPSSHTSEQHSSTVAVTSAWFPCGFAAQLVLNRSDLCKTSPNALESDPPPTLPFHKAHFHQHCIWSFFLTFRGCSVSS